MEKKKNLSSSQNFQWVRGNLIGKGSFGTVNLAVDKADGHIFAVKSVNSNSSLPFHFECLENEIQILQSLSSPYVVQYLADDVTQESPTTSYRNLHMEYLPGGTVVDVANHFRPKEGDFNEQIVRSFTRYIVLALKYIHSMGVVHCDVKGRNILVGSIAGVAKLADFGSAKRISGEGGKVLSSGTPLWMAPEVVRQEKQGPESDVWSLGCTVIEMITGKPAWKDSGVSTMIRIGFSDELPEFPAQLSEMGRDFLDKCLKREPSERWNCEELLRHPFVSESIVKKSSPRSILDYSNSEFCDDEENEEQREEEEEDQFCLDCNSHSSRSNFEETVIFARDRVGELASGRRVLWESDGWDVVRLDSIFDNGEAPSASGGDYGENREGTSSEYSNLISIIEESVGTRLEYLICKREICW